MTKLFLYGTLMQGLPNNRVLPEGSRFLGDATVRGRLYSLGGRYPGLRLYYGESSLDGLVYGEVWEVPSTDPTDRLEGFRPADPEGSHYRRVPVIAVLDEATVPVETYEYNHPVEGWPPVVDGDWRAELVRMDAEGGDDDDD